MNIEIPEKLKAIACALESAGATKVVLVGGAVRDHLLGVTPKDFDVEIYGMSYSEIVEVIEGMGYTPIFTGKAFGIVKIKEVDFDISVPRKENKIGVGHTDFDVEFPANITVMGAAARRDFTFNAMGIELIGGEPACLLDPFHGESDLKAGIMRATSEHFREDPLRVLRGMQFASRMAMVASPATTECCREILWSGKHLPKERVWEEWRKWSLGAYPHVGLEFLRLANWVQLYPELNNLIDLKQDVRWHPEGDVWNHTHLVVGHAAKIGKDLPDNDRMTLIFAALLHDVGKAVCTEEEKDGSISSKKHASEGVPLAEKFLLQIGAPFWIIPRVQNLVNEHMTVLGDPSPRSVRRLANRLGDASFHLWALLVESDQAGRWALGKSCDRLREWERIAKEVAVEEAKPVPILMGRHLLDLGVAPGPRMGEILREAFELQLDGEFDDLGGALKCAIKQVKSV